MLHSRSPITWDPHPSPGEAAERPSRDRALVAMRELVVRAGERWTRQRERIGEAVLGLPRHSTVDAITEVLRRSDRTISTATVYRTVKVFAAVGVLTRLAADSGPSRYEIALGRTPHHHLIDITSGEVIELQDARLQAAMEKAAADLGYRLVNRGVGIQVVPEGSSRG